MNIYEKLLHVQSELNAPKKEYNSFGKYHYRNCEGILEAVKPLLAKVKATIILVDEIIEINGRFYVKATASFIDIETEIVISASAFAREADDKKGMDLAQVSGATSSYAKKYALNGLLLIDDSKDADFANGDTNTPATKQNAEKAPKNVQSAPSGPTREQVIAKCVELAKTAGMDVEEVRAYCEAAKNEELGKHYRDLVALQNKEG